MERMYDEWLSITFTANKSITITWQRLKLLHLHLQRRRILFIILSASRAIGQPNSTDTCIDY